MQNDTSAIKKVIWLYFYLLIFEGALRKWILPGLAQPLLIVRDPLAIWLIYKSLSQGVWKPNTYVIITWLISMLALVFTLLVGHGNLAVAFYGLRITLLHFPVIFIIGNVFNKSDVLQMGKIVLWITIGMTLLVTIQLFSPQTAWVNKGIGDEGGSGFQGSGDFLRVPGTFSFTNGLSLFYGFAAPFVFYFWLNNKDKFIPKYLLMGGALALVSAAPLSISRTVLFELFLTSVFMLIISGKNPKVIKQVIGAGIGIVVLLVFLSSFSFFNSATDAFTTRFTEATSAEGGVEGVFVDRFLGGLFGAITDTNATFFGLGLGLGTNAGSKLLTGGVVFTIAEGEWGRLIGEMGFLLGMLMIIIRISITLRMMSLSWRAISFKNTLPWMLCSFGFLTVMQAQWAQPTALGFGVMIGGLILAAIKDDTELVVNT